MNFEIAAVLIILAGAVLLFITEWVRMDVVALLVLVSLALTGLVTPTEALSGFANPAVVTVWAVLVLSAGLSRSGVANIVGSRLVKIAGSSEIRLVFLIMLTTGLLSGFMNAIGVVAFMLPVVIDMSRSLNISPSKLLMPLAFASLLGGLNTMIGTPPNILVSEILGNYGLEPFRMFDYTPVGLIIMTVGIIFMVSIGRKLLPDRNIEKELSVNANVDLKDFFGLEERLFVLEIKEDSNLVGMNLAESRLGSGLGLNVIAIIEEDKIQLAPGPDTLLQPGVRLISCGRLDRVLNLNNGGFLDIADDQIEIDKLISSDIVLAEIKIGEGSSLAGKTVGESGLRDQYKVNVVAVTRDEIPRRTNFLNMTIQSGDTLLVHASTDRIEDLKKINGLTIIVIEDADFYRLQERLFAVQVPPDSYLIGKSLTESRLGDTFGLSVLGITRRGQTILNPPPRESLQGGDVLLVEGKPEDISALRGLQELEADQLSKKELEKLESDKVGLAEVILSPRTKLAGKTLHQIHFREKFGLSVLAIWREGRAYRSNLRDMALKMGDSLLVHGSRRKLMVLGSEPDFLVLTEAAQEAPRIDKAPVALAIMAIVLVPVIFGWLPIVITAVLGVALMVLGNVLSMEEAYHAIEWKAIFLIAGMLPLGLALQESGAASLIAEGIVALIGGYGPLAVTAGLFALAALSSQVMPNPAVAVLFSPIAYNTAINLGLSPYPLFMTIAVSASAAFLSPVGHPANMITMGPGGYRFKDYIKVGLPLTLVVMVVLLVILPVFWPYF
ncbi:MAG: SLC13 family permease [Anaerolineales bacterium]